MKKVMIIDDNPISTFMVKKLIDSNEVIEINDTNNVYNEIKYHKPNLLVLDLIMPNESGFDIIKKVKEEMKDISIIVLSSLSSDESKVKAYNLGADMFISKPFRLNYLRDIINEKLSYIN